MNIAPPPGILTDEEFATIQAAGGPQAAPPEDRDWMAAQVNQYKAFRISAPRDEDIAARTASRNFLDKLTLDPDNIASANGIDLIAKAPPEQQAATRDRLVVDAWLTDRLRSQTVITPDGSTPAPELDPMRRDEYRDALAQELFGDSAPKGSDAAVVAQLRTKADERRRHRILIGGQDGTDDAAKAATAASLARWAARSAYAGESAVQGFAKWKQQAQTSANWTPIAEKQALFEAWTEVYGDTKAKAAPYQAAVRQTLDNLKALAEAKDVLGMPDQSPQKFDDAIRPLLNLDEQTLRNIALPALRSMAELETKAGGTGSFWDEMKDQLGKSFMRPFGQGVGALKQILSENIPIGEESLVASGLIPPLAKRQSQNLARTMLRSALTTDIDPIKPNAESAMGKRLEQMAYDVAGTAAYMTMLSIPYAGTAMATASFADDTTAMLLNKHPDMKPSDARAIAAVAAPIQVGIEQLQRLQVLGKLPVFNQLMNKLAAPGGNAMVRFGIYGGIGAAVEYTEEKLQDAAPLAVQALAFALKKDIPQANLDGFELLDLRTFLAVAPFALIGAGINVAQDKAAIRLMVSDEAAMRAVGISEDGIQSIQAAGTVEAQTQAIQQAWAARDTTAPADERWQETVRKAAADSQAAAMKEAEAMARAAGVQEVKRAPDGSMHITLGDGTVAVAGDAVEAQAIIEGATEAAQGWDDLKPLTDMIDALDARPDAVVGAIDATFEERANVADLITRFTDTANDEALPQAERDAAANYVQSLQQRAAIYEAQNPGTKVDWRKVTVAGQSDMQVREGVATAIIRVDKGASPYVVLEETVEADFKAMEQSGEMTQADAVRELRELERRTGDAYLSAWTGTNPAADRLAIVEGLSKAAQIYATGKARAGGEAGSRAAGVLREWRKAQRGKLMQAEREGVAPKIIAYLKQKAEWLRAVIGQAIRMNRARREAQAAGETFPLERFLQRVTGVAVETQAAEEVTDAAAEVWDDEGLSYIPPEDDELTPFSFQPQSFSFSFVEEYGINHRPNDSGPRAFDLTEDNLMPGDVYDHPEWYSAMEPKVIRETMTQLKKVRGKPDAELVIYRAGPVGEMNPGDWISLSKEYARTHADAQDPENFKVWQAKVKAADVRWAMDDLAEFGYWGEQKAAVDSGVSFSFQPTAEKDAAFADAYARGDTEAAQAMVDEAARAAGYNVGPVWHSTDADFTVFDPAKVKPGSDNRYGPAFYFTEDKREEVKGRKTPRQFRAYIKGALFEFAGKDADIPQSVRKSETVAEAAAKMADYGYDGFKVNFGDGSGNQGFYVGVYDPARIKSADPFTFDESGALIPLSQRFDATRPEISFSFQPTGIFQMSDTSPMAGVTIAPESQATAKGLADRIDAMYESGQTDGVEDLEAQLEAMLDLMDTGSADLEQAAEETRDIDQFSPSPEEALVRAWISWNNPTVGYRPSEEFPTFGAFMRSIEGDASWTIQPEVTDQQIEDAARDAMAQYMRRREALTNATEQAPLTSFSMVQTEHLRDDTRFDALQKEGRVEIGGNIDAFKGQHIMLHAPDNAFAGTITLPGGGTVQGKGGVYYPALYADENYFWASTKAVAERTAKHLNQSGAKNGGRILMGLISAPVEKLFSSSTGAMAAVTFIKSLTTIKAAGVTEKMLNTMLVRASKAKAIKTGHEFGFTLDAKKDLAANMARLPDLLAPDNAIFAVRKAFVESLADQLASLMRAKPKQSKVIADILTAEENKHAKSQIIAGKLSKASIVQGLGNLLTEPFLRVFQQFDAGRIYAIVEVAGPVKAIPSDKHESYPFAIVPQDPAQKVKLTVMAEAVDWQDAVGKEEGDYTTKEERFVYMPTAGMSAPDLKVLGRRPDSESNALSFSFQPTAILDDLAAKVEARMSRSPQARLDAVRAAVDNLAALKQAWQKRRDGAGISDDRSKASIDAEADVRQAFRAAELMQAAGISYATAREIVEGRRRTYEETLARETHARGVEDKTAQAIRREAATRQAFKRDELLQKVDEDFAQTLSTVYREFGFWDGPALNFLSKQDKGSRKGVLMSYSKAKKFAGKGAYVNPAIWDGSHELPRSLFAGTMQPDVAAQELFSAHPELFPASTTAADVTPDMMWEAIGRELKDNKRMAEATKAYTEATRATAEESREWAEQWETEYKAQLEAARMAADAAASAYVATATDGNEAAEKATAQAVKEAAAWKRKALTMQNQDWGSKETLVRAMRTLDAILSAFPAAVRGKVGGWLALARIGTQDRMAEEIDRRITILDRELERELRKDALEELDALRERAKPKREAGKKPTGKLGAEAHRFFERIEAVADLTADEVEAAGLTLETLAVKATTPEEQADIYERQQILDQFGGLDARDAAGVPLHDAQALAAALAAAETVYETGRNQWRTQEEARLAEVQAMAQEVTAAVGAAPLSRILAQGDAAKKLSGMLRGGSVSLRSFREVLHLIMGRDNPLAKQWADRAMDAMHARTDELADIRRRWRAAMEAATGQRRHKAEARVWDMGTKRTVAVTVRPGRPISDVIPIESIPNLAGLGYNVSEIADAEAAFLALPADSRAKNITIIRWQKDTEEAVQLTDAEAVYYSMLWRQEQYRENLNRAGLGQETQDEIEAGMSDAAKALREFMSAEYAAGYYPLASLFRGMFGVDLPQIANYAPGKWWSRGVEKPMDPSGAGMVEGGFRAGMLKDRKAHLAEPKPENAFALWLGHVSQTAHWKAVAPLARELRGVFGHPEVKKAITARHGAETLDALNRWLDAIEANGVRTNFPAWAQTLLGWQANVKLAWKVGTILKQSTGLLAAAYRMPLKAYASGMRRLVTGQIDVKDVWNSPMIQRRLESGFAPEVRAAISRTFTDAPTLRRRFVQQGMELIGYADAFFATASAAIHYDWQLSQIREAVPGISDAAAKAHAMRETQLVVNATAQPVEITERSLVEMGGFGKVFLIFGSEARQKSSMWITAWARVLQKQATEEDWRTLAIMHLIVGPMVQLITSAWMDARDDDDDEWFDEKNWSAWDFVRSMGLGPMAGIPIIRDLTDGFSGDSGPTAQTAKAMQSAVKIVKGPEDSEDEAIEWYAQRTAEILKGADSFTAVVAGIGEQAFRISDNIFDTQEEIQGKIDTLTRKVGRTKDEGERQELLERIAGLRERLK